MKRIFTVGALLTLPLLTAAGQPPIDQRHFSETAFDAVELAGPDNVEIVSGAARDVVASGDPRAIAALDIGVRDGRLRIGRKPSRYHGRGATITVTMPHIRAVRLTSSGSLGVSRFNEDAFEAMIAGSGSLRASAMHVGSGAFTLTGSGSLDLNGVTATDLDLAARSSGSIDASGTTRSVSIDLAGSGSVDTSSLRADTVSVSQTGSGNVHALADRQATIRSAASGSVTIAGHPKCMVSGATARRVTCG